MGKIRTNKAINPPLPEEDEEIENLVKSVNDLGQDVAHFKLGKMKIKVTFLNNPSEEAIKRTNQIYNEITYKINASKNP